jgi:SAM-dependent methyltransferase
MNLLEEREIKLATSSNCPVCESITERTRDAPGWGEWRRCHACTLEFAHPLRLGKDPLEFFDGAYRGKVKENAMDDFANRVKQREIIVHKLQDPTLWFWTPAFHDVLNWLKKRFKSGSTVLELGCGLGFFLHTLRREGFQAVGLDVAQIAVDLNREDGFPVWHGQVESVPVNWMTPDAIVAFFMLHHLDDPLSFLKTVRERWPNVPLAIAQYGPSNLSEDRSSPPRTLIRWNSQSLATALGLAGYQPTVYNILSTGAERSSLRLIRKALAQSMRLPQVYRFGKKLESYVLSHLPKTMKQGSYVILAFADPVAESAPGNQS